MTTAQTPLTSDLHVLLQLMTIMRQALEKLPAERALIEQAPQRERMYRKGLVDGVEETIGALFDALCRGCAGGHGLADNAHTRDARCLYGAQDGGQADG